MKEYKIITDDNPENLQKWLNWWNHQYVIEIISYQMTMIVDDVVLTSILLTRERRDHETVRTGYEVLGDEQQLPNKGSVSWTK